MPPLTADELALALACDADVQPPSDEAVDAVTSAVAAARHGDAAAA